VNAGFDTYRVISGRRTSGEAITNTVIGAYSLTGPMQAATGALYYGIQEFYPGGWLGDGSHIPYNGAGALSDYGTTYERNRAIVPDFQMMDVGPMR